MRPNMKDDAKTVPPTYLPSLPMPAIRARRL